MKQSGFELGILDKAHLPSGWHKMMMDLVD